MEKKTDGIAEPMLEFQHQLKAQKERTIYSLYHTGFSAVLLDFMMGKIRGITLRARARRRRGGSSR